VINERVLEIDIMELLLGVRRVPNIIISNLVTFLEILVEYFIRHFNGKLIGKDLRILLHY
jgi:hypothetical protein